VAASVGGLETVVSVTLEIVDLAAGVGIVDDSRRVFDVRGLRGSRTDTFASANSSFNVFVGFSCRSDGASSTGDGNFNCSLCSVLVLGVVPLAAFRRFPVEAFPINKMASLSDDCGLAVVRLLGEGMFVCWSHSLVCAAVLAVEGAAV
jgi:hypothetical protein